MNDFSRSLNSDDSPPDWNSFEEVSQTFKDLWDEVNGFRVAINDLQAENNEISGEVEELKSALESAEADRCEQKTEIELLTEQVNKLEEMVAELSEERS